MCVSLAYIEHRNWRSPLLRKGHYSSPETRALLGESAHHITCLLSRKGSVSNEEHSVSRNTVFVGIVDHTSPLYTSEIFFSFWEERFGTRRSVAFKPKSVGAQVQILPNAAYNAKTHRQDVSNSLNSRFTSYNKQQGFHKKEWFETVF